MNIPYGTARPPSYDNNYNDKHKKYTVSQKKRPTLSFAVTLTNIDGFSKFFYWYIVWKICNNAIINMPPHLNCVATLPYETLM